MSDTPVSWLILTHNTLTMERSMNLLRETWRLHHTYVIHVDKSVSNSDYVRFVKQIKSLFPNHDNILVMSELTGGHKHELVEIELRMLQTILGPWPTPLEINYYYENENLLNSINVTSSSNLQTREWKYAAVISGDSYPLQDIDVIVRRISCRQPSVNNLEYQHDNTAWKTRSWIKASERKEITKKLLSTYRKCGRKPNPPVLWGAQWVVLTRDFAEYAITSEFAHELFDSMKQFTYAGDEAYFQTLLYASCRSDFFSSDVHRSPTKAGGERFMISPIWRGVGPNLELKPEDIDLMLESDAMFTRKVWTLETEQAIISRKPRSRNHETDYLHYCGGY